jgi:hypothetical protein
MAASEAGLAALGSVKPASNLALPLLAHHSAALSREYRSELGDAFQLGLELDLWFWR